MEKNLIVLMVVSIIIFVLAIIIMIFIAKKKKIRSFLNKVTVSDQKIGDDLKSKLDLIIRIINIVERELKIESKVFEEVKKIKSEKINNIVLDNILTDATKEIIEFKNDYKELSKTKSFDGLISDVKGLDVYLSGGRKFYNKYAAVYNNLINSFPSSIVARYEKLTNRALYTENILEEDLKMDFTK